MINHLSAKQHQNIMNRFHHIAESVQAMTFLDELDIKKEVIKMLSNVMRGIELYQSIPEENKLVKDDYILQINYMCGNIENVINKARQCV